MIVELGFIYYLKNTQTEEIFYVGCTEVSLKNRLRTHYQHLNEVNRGKRKINARYEYLMSMLPLKASIHLIEIVSNNDMHLREIYYISEYRKLHKLTNMTDGGKGGNTFKHQNNISKSKIGDKISIKLKGKKKPIGFSDNLSNIRKGNLNPMAGKSKIGWIVCDSVRLFKYGYEINQYLNNQYAYGNICKIVNKDKKAYNHKWSTYDKCDQEIQDIVQSSYESLK